MKAALIYTTAWLAFVPAMFVSAHAEVHQVTISTTAFEPKEFTARVGDTVEWINKDFIDHTATAADKSFDVVLPTGKRKTVVLAKSGTVNYSCRFHPNMKGKITVGDK
jgi:plastocyanin